MYACMYVYVCIYIYIYVLLLQESVVSGWVASGYRSFPLRKHRGDADRQLFKHVLQCEGQHSDPS